MTYAVYTADAKSFRFAPKFPSDIAPLSREERERRGWYDLEAVPPVTDENHEAVIVGYERTELGYRRIYEVREAVRIVRYARWGVIKALQKRELYEPLHAALMANAMLFAAFYGPDWFESTNETFVEVCGILQRQFELTDEEMAAILAESLYDEN